MNNDLSCNTVKDLLPIYLDGIASEETNICVKKHLSECEPCQSEYKNLCEITEKSGEVVISEAASIKTLRKRLITWFLTVIILGIVLVSIAMFCYTSESMYSHPTIFNIAVLSQYVAIYFLPLFAMFVAIIWKKTIAKKEKDFWPNVIIWFLAILVVKEVFFLLWHFFFVIRWY